MIDLENNELIAIILIVVINFTMVLFAIVNTRNLKPSKRVNDDY